ncbi:MAG: CRTAC1 family protein [Bacteroidetes bacterium]|jgi:tetratricopeptide (TPR) repeat protein|nr:CRTAC1 family protein [Bacteroidota bacterium]MDF1867796.1 CRTAC1 family protein [Saprospiraceae bacterium]
MITRFFYILPILFLLFIISCQSSDNSNVDIENPVSKTKSGTEEMAEILSDIDAKANPMSVTYFKNSIRAEVVRQRMEGSANADERFKSQMFYGYELLNAGKNEEAIMTLEDLVQKVSQSSVPQPKVLYQLNRLLALCYIRLGEQNNCLENSNPERCIMPFEGGGIYEMKSSVKKAIQLFEQNLAQNPNDLEAIWILNFAYMTIGEYPEKVPAKWRLDEKEFESDYQLPRFNNISGKLGINTVGLCGGASVEDYDNDGFLDIVASSWGFSDQLRFFKNNGDGTFSDRTTESKLTGLTGGLNITHTDYNNDGFKDILVLRGAWFGTTGELPNSLIKNNGDGTFEDVTIAAGLFSKYPTQAASWADFNNDGWLDLFIGNETESQKIQYPCELYMNNGDGTFTNKIAESGLRSIRAMVKGCTAADANNDGWTDLYISFLNAPNVLVLNNGANDKGMITFSASPKRETVQEPTMSFPCWFFDFNNDGWEDIFVASFGGYGETKLQAAQVAAKNYRGEFAEGNPRLYRNNGDGSFTNIGKEAGLMDGAFAMGSNYGDIDNDGFLDFYLGTGAPSFAAVVPNKMFRNNQGKTFQDVTTAGGFGHVQKGHGVGFGDLDNDGDEDIFCVLGGAFEGDVFGDALFLNPMGSEKSWVNLELEGTKSNKAAIGARVKIITEQSNGKELILYRTISTGGSFGANSLRLELGLGAATKIKLVEVKWPNLNQTVEVFENIEIRRFVKLVEGSGKLEYLNRKSFGFTF